MRRESYPSSGLEGVIRLIEILGAEMLDKNTLKTRGATADSIRLAEILGILEALGQTNKYYKLSECGLRLLHADVEDQKIRMFVLLSRDNRILPSYFKELVDRLELHNRNLTTEQLSQELHMEDKWSADILSEWCRYLGISKGRSKNEVFISSERVAKLRQGSFSLVLQEEYDRLCGSSGLVPVARLRREINDSGVLSSRENFDELLFDMTNTKDSEGKIAFHPAPPGLVGQGLKGVQGCELISLKCFARPAGTTGQVSS